MNDQDDSEKSRLESVRVSNATCPICKSPVSPRYRPFCSRRCADVDLHRWLGGAYRMPTNEVPDPDLLEAELRIAQQRNEED